MNSLSLATKHMSAALFLDILRSLGKKDLNLMKNEVFVFL